MKNLKTVLKIVAALVLVCTAVFAFLHRRVIWSAIKGEPLGECPYWPPKKWFKKKKA